MDDEEIVEDDGKEEDNEEDYRIETGKDAW